MFLCIILFRKQIAARETAQRAAEISEKKTMKPVDETEAIADVWKRIDELQEEHAQERSQRRKLQEEVGQ